MTFRPTRQMDICRCGNPARRPTMLLAARAFRLAQLRRRDPSGAGPAAGGAGGVRGLQADHAGADRARSGQCPLAARSCRRTISSAGPASAGPAAGGAGGVRGLQGDHAGADRARSGQCRLAARRRRTIASGRSSGRASCRRRWRSTTCKRIMQELTARDRDNADWGRELSIFASIQRRRDPSGAGSAARRRWRSTRPPSGSCRS